MRNEKKVCGRIIGGYALQRATNGTFVAPPDFFCVLREPIRDGCGLSHID
jgi:hypothetical protein